MATKVLECIIHRSVAIEKQICTYVTNGLRYRTTSLATKRLENLTKSLVIDINALLLDKICGNKRTMK